MDRCHRLGQKNPVVVYRLVGYGSIEDKMFRVQVGSYYEKNDSGTGPFSGH